MGALLNLGCENNQSLNVNETEQVVEIYDSLGRTPVSEGYLTEQKIDFSHSTHSQINELSDCKKCHITSGKKVELNMCSNCHHNDINENLNLTYYERLDSISEFIRKMNNTLNTK